MWQSPKHAAHLVITGDLEVLRSFGQVFGTKEQTTNGLQTLGKRCPQWVQMPEIGELFTVIPSYDPLGNHALA